MLTTKRFVWNDCTHLDTGSTVVGMDDVPFVAAAGAHFPDWSVADNNWDSHSWYHCHSCTRNAWLLR